MDHFLTRRDCFALPIPGKKKKGYRRVSFLSVFGEKVLLTSRLFLPPR